MVLLPISDFSSRTLSPYFFCELAFSNLYSKSTKYDLVSLYFSHDSPSCSSTIANVSSCTRSNTYLHMEIQETRKGKQKVNFHFLWNVRNIDSNIDIDWIFTINCKFIFSNKKPIAIYAIDHLLRTRRNCLEFLKFKHTRKGNTNLVITQRTFSDRINNSNRS